MAGVGCGRQHDHASPTRRDLRAQAKQLAPHLAWMADQIAFRDEVGKAGGAGFKSIVLADRDPITGEITMRELEPPDGGLNLTLRLVRMDPSINPLFWDLAEGESGRISVRISEV